MIQPNANQVNGWQDEGKGREGKEGKVKEGQEGKAKEWKGREGGKS